MKLKELCLATTADIATGIIKGRTKETNKIFHDIRELTAQFQLDTVSTFDIVFHRGERVLVVKLANWGN